MPFHFRTRIPSQARNIPFISFFHSLSNQTTSKLSQTLKMATGTSSKRPMCPSCSKPSRLCLCTRIKTPNLNNSVAVTILQHTLEQKHPLNSTRIATLGLKNLNVVPVSDVNSEAQFVIRPLESDSGTGLHGSEKRNNGSCESSDFNQVSEFERIHNAVSERPLINFRISKYGVISPNFDLIFGSPLVLGALAEGFLVRKRQNKLVNGSIKSEEFEEFEIAVPPGSALLFPNEKSVDIEAIAFEVKNLIVLDGTWAKAKRIYSENPWLKILPHLKLDLDKMSLYSEVRHQPRAGYLSTIESIVYALKAVGDRTAGLDNLLEVFESMVGDQRRCKDERISKISLT